MFPSRTLIYGTSLSSHAISLNPGISLDRTVTNSPPWMSVLLSQAGNDWLRSRERLWMIIVQSDIHAQENLPVCSLIFLGAFSWGVQAEDCEISLKTGTSEIAGCCG